MALGFDPIWKVFLDLTLKRVSKGTWKTTNNIICFFSVEPYPGKGIEV